MAAKKVSTSVFVFSVCTKRETGFGRFVKHWLSSHCKIGLSLPIHLNEQRAVFGFVFKSTGGVVFKIFKQLVTVC